MKEARISVSMAEPISPTSLQPLIRVQTLSIKCWKQSLLSTPTREGSPKYLSVSDSVTIFSRLDIGTVTAQQAKDWGFSGVMLRGRAT